ncbi:uncharacterized protein LOC135831720 isoform X2 [Planococcus citri]|uniref:uncharacterized protein LOC135831720 isoform X2 n=1 Tax=Planococcus citri TaxID=170843 RepID=UPI0031F79C4A
MISSRTTYDMVVIMNCVGCGSRDTSGFFKFPTDPRVRTIWLEECGLDPSTPLALEARLCNKHFKKDDIVFDGKRPLLKTHAVPSIRVDPVKTDRQGYRYEKTCYVCGYTSGDSFHKIPKDPEIRSLWLRNLGIKEYHFNPITTTYIHLCNSHFAASDLLGHPHSLKRRLRKGALPLVQPQNGKNTQKERLTKRKNGDDDLSDPDVTFVSSSSSNAKCSITLADDAEEHTKSKTSKVNPQNSKLISSREKNILKKKVSNQSTISSKEENAPIATIDLTCEDVGESALLAKKRKHVRNLILKKKLLRQQLSQHRDLLNSLIKDNLVTEKGKKIIKKFLRNFPAE